MFKLVELDNLSSNGKLEVGRTNYFNYDGINFEFGRIISSTVKSIISN